VSVVDAASVVRATRRRRARREVVVAAVLVALTFLLLCLSVSVGAFPVPLADVAPAIFGRGDGATTLIVQTLRLPRALLGVLTGAAFGLSGALFQSFARNPLASPDVIGVTAGASAAAVFVLVSLGGTYATVSAGAFVGGLLAALVVYLLAYRRGLSSYRLVLVGIGIGAVLLSITDFLLTRADIYDAQRAMVWLTGSLAGLGWERVRPLTLLLCVLVPAALALTRPVRALQLGDDTARSLGFPVERTKIAIVVVGVALASAATAAAGPIVFVAFVAPAIARQLTRSSGPTLVASGLLGSALVLGADVLARQVTSGVELPVGIVTGVLGAPYLLFLLARANRAGRGG
jgi:iron complex transport system permease protein